MDGLYAHLIDANFKLVSVPNDSTLPLIVPQHQRIGKVLGYHGEEFPICLAISAFSNL